MLLVTIVRGIKSSQNNAAQTRFHECAPLMRILVSAVSTSRANRVVDKLKQGLPLSYSPLLLPALHLNLHQPKHVTEILKASLFYRISAVTTYSHQMAANGSLFSLHSESLPTPPLQALTHTRCQSVITPPLHFCCVKPVSFLNYGL